VTVVVHLKRYLGGKAVQNRPGAQARRFGEFRLGRAFRKVGRFVRVGAGESAIASKTGQLGSELREPLSMPGQGQPRVSRVDLLSI
jgi:hypothetical protein